MADESPAWQVLSKRVLHASPFGIDIALWTVRLPDGTVVKDQFWITIDRRLRSFRSVLTGGSS